MKQCSTEPPKKKLKQARLPFQILSPPVVKNCEESPLSQCKRKACETSSDEDVVVSEINENKVVPVEKKAKINKDKNQEKRQNNDVGMEVEEIEGEKKFLATAEKKQSNSIKKGNKATSKQKGIGKSSAKVPKNEKSGINTPNSKPEIIEVINLCESPAKNPEKEETVIKVPNYQGDKSVSNAKVTDVIEDSGSKSVISCIKQEKNITNSQIPKSKENDAPKETSLTAKVSSDECKNKLSQNEEIEKKNPEGFSEIDKTIVKESSSNDADPACNSNSKNSDNNCNVNSSSNQPLVKTEVVYKSPNTGTDPISENQDFKESDSNICSTPARNRSSLNSSKESVASDSDLQTPSVSNDTLTKDDSSPSSECDTSSVSTPGTDSVKKTPKTPRRMTPNQLLKLKEKDEKKKERERLKEEKDKKKAEEKEEKLRLKKEKEEERLRLKQEKEDEKRKEKEEKEKKKQAELEQKNEEKRLKEEEKRQKEEEKRVKEEEKKRKEEDEKRKKEEKRLREEQKEAEKRKSAQAFASFFVKTEVKPTGAEEVKESTPVESIFQPFEVKNDMRLAPLVRSQLVEDRRQVLDSVLECNTQAAQGQRLYLEQIRNPSYVCGCASRTFPPPDETDDEVIIVESEQPNEDMEVDEDKTEKKPEKRHHRAKLLQFHENRRPPYWGTWRKKSKLVRPRAPLNQDKTMLEYEVDSDDEWEEPEDGESLRGSEDEESQDEQYEEDNDMFVPHGYLSDGEGEDELDDQSPEAMKAKLKLLQLEFEAERNEKQLKLKPRLIGCVWFSNLESSASNVGSQIAELFLSRRAVWAGPLPVTVAPPVPSSPSSAVSSGTADTPGEVTKSGCKKKVVKESMIPDVIKKVHGSRKKLSKLLVEMLEEWDKDKAEYVPSKACLAKKIREMAVWEKPTGAVHHCWYIKDEVRRAYGLPDLDLPPPPAAGAPTTPSPVSNITKFTKVLTTDERLKLLRDSPTVTKEVPKDASRTTPPTPTQNGKTPTIKLGTPSAPAVKKRVSLITLGPKESPKQSSSSSIMNFVTKSVKGEGSDCAPKKEETVKVEEKVRKRIAPITLTTSVSKANPAPVEDECIVLDD